MENKFQQGEDYEDSTSEDYEEITSETEETLLGQLKDWYHYNTTLALAIGGGIIVVIIIIIVVIMMSGKSKNEVIEEEITEEIIDYSDINFEELPEPDPEPVFSYDDDVYSRLRAAGFTSRQIEELEERRAEPESYITKAAKKKQAFLAEEFKALIRDASASTDVAYTYVLGNSYLGLDPQETYLEDKTVNVVLYKDNADYWKMPLQGYQPTIKLRLKNGEILYFQITPQRYVQLDDSGNMQITYAQTELYGAVFITDIKEIN